MKTKLSCFLILVVLLTLSNYKVLSKEYFRFDTSAKIEGANFSHFSVIDQRYEKENVGFLKKGVNFKVNLCTKKSLDVEISDYINYISDKKSNGDSLVLVLYDFSIQDRPNRDELGTFHFDGMFYIGSKNRYVLLAQVDTFFEVRSNWDVTKLLLETSQNSFLEIIEGVLNQQASSSETSLNRNQLPTHRADLYKTFPAYNVAVFKEGVYYTIKDFVNQTPKDTPIVVSHHTVDGVNTPYFYYSNKKGKRTLLISEQFAVTHKGASFSNDHWLIYPIKIVNGDIYCRRYFKGIKRKESQYGYMFGLAGAILIDATSSPMTADYGVYEARLDPVNKVFKPVRRLN